MSKEIPLESLTFTANADLSAKQYYAVKLDSNGQIGLAGDGEFAVGILQDNPESGKVGNVMTLGISFAQAGGTIAAGANVACDANGKLVTAAEGDYIVGVALVSAVVGDIFSVLLSIKDNAKVSAGYTYLQFKVDFADMDNVKIVDNLIPGFAGTIEKIFLVTDDPTTDAALVNFVVTPSIGGVDVTGGVLTVDVTADATDPDLRGLVIDATAITAAKTFAATDAIDLTVADTANAFTDGNGTIFVLLKYTA